MAWSIPYLRRRSALAARRSAPMVVRSACELVCIGYLLAGSFERSVRCLDGARLPFARPRACFKRFRWRPAAVSIRSAAGRLRLNEQAETEGACH